jgi:hypothetical protein
VVPGSMPNMMRSFANEIYFSILIITGRINCVFTLMPRLMAGSTFGKLTKRAIKMLSAFILL